jgi:RNA polymerase sigma-70 factor (ECF subfamily)
MTEYHNNWGSLDDAALLRCMAVEAVRDDAMSELYDRYGRLVYTVALHAVGHQATAEEITLDVFRQAWQKADTYQPERAQVRTWLVSMARNRAIDVLRREAVRPEKNSLCWAVVMADPVADGENPETAVASNLRRQRVRRAITELPPEQQEVLLLAYYQGCSHSQIAEATGLPLGTVKTRIKLAMQKLRHALPDKEV